MNVYREATILAGAVLLLGVPTFHIADDAVDVGFAVSTAIATEAPQTMCWECHTIQSCHPEWTWCHDDSEDYFYPVSPPDFKHETIGVDTCTGSHEFMCGPETDELEVLVASLEAGDLDAIANSYIRLGDLASLNSDRNAIQLLSCQDADVVVAHLQVPVESFGALSAALEASSAVAQPSNSQRH